MPEKIKAELLEEAELQEKIKAELFEVAELPERQQGYFVKSQDRGRTARATLELIHLERLAEVPEKWWKLISQRLICQRDNGVELLDFCLF